MRHQLLIITIIFYVVTGSSPANCDNGQCKYCYQITNEFGVTSQQCSQSSSCSQTCNPRQFSKRGCCNACHATCESCNGPNQNQCTICISKYFKNSSNYCVQIICGDSIFVHNSQQQCDNGNSTEPDGCSNDCKQEEYYICRNQFNNNTKSDCKIQKPILISFVSAIKDPYSNFMVMLLTTSITFQFMKKLNYSQIIDLGIPTEETVFTYYPNGTIIVQIKYSNNLQMKKQPFILNYDFKKSGLSILSEMTRNQTQYILKSSGNLAINFYSNETYSKIDTIGKLCMILSLIVLSIFVVSMFRGKIVGFQLLGTFQLSYCGLVLIRESDPLFYSMWSLVYSNGYCYQFQNQQPNQLPVIFQFVHISKQMIFNYNIMLLTPVVMCLISLLLTIWMKIFNHSRARLNTMKDNIKTFLGQYFYMFLGFSVYPVFFYFGIMMRYFENTGFFFYLSIGVGASYIVILLITIFLFKQMKEDYFGQLKLFFRTEPQFYQKYFFSVQILLRAIIGLSLGVAGEYYYVGILAIILILGHCFSIYFLRPYALMAQNYRSMFMKMIQVINLSIYLYVTINGPFVTNVFRIYCPFVVLAMLCLSILVTLVFVSYHFKRYLQINSSFLQSVDDPDPSKEEKKQQQQIFNDQLKKKLQEYSKKSINLSKMLLSGSSRNKRIKTNIILPEQSPEDISRCGDRLLQRIVNFQQYQEEWLQREKRESIQHGLLEKNQEQPQTKIAVQQQNQVRIEQSNLDKECQQ